MYSSSGLDRYPPVKSHRRSQRSRSRSRRRYEVRLLFSLSLSFVIDNIIKIDLYIILLISLDHCYYHHFVSREKKKI
jgi:hypothetical protein